MGSLGLLLFCEVCTLKQRVLEEAGGELRANMNTVRHELKKPTHAISALWRYKVGLCRTTCQLFLHLRELVDAVDRSKLKPLIEVCQPASIRRRLRAVPSLPCPLCLPCRALAHPGVSVD